MPSETEKAFECLRSWWENGTFLRLRGDAVAPVMELAGGKLSRVDADLLEFNWTHSVPSDRPLLRGWGNISVNLEGLTLSVSGVPLDAPLDSDLLITDTTVVKIARDDRVYCTIRPMI